MSIPWNLVIPGIVEVSKEIIDLCKSRKTNKRKQREAQNFIRDKFPGIKEHQVNLVIELVVYAHKQGLPDTEVQRLVQRTLDYLDAQVKAIKGELG